MKEGNIQIFLIIPIGDPHRNQEVEIETNQR
jgi:hypothetical protein